MQLELLKPAKWDHEVKVWLDKWYQKLGYRPGQPTDIAIAHPHIASMLCCDCVFTPYRKQLI